MTLADTSAQHHAASASLSTGTVVDVVDYGGGNLGSLKRCLMRLDIPFQVVDGSVDKPVTGDRPVILPGVGAFGSVMKGLKDRNLVDSIRQTVAQGTPFLGVCVGLQVVLEGSDESPGVSGLGLLPGQVKRFTQGKIPQIGWNYIEPVQDVAGFEAGYVYFVNSYVAYPEDLTHMFYAGQYYGSFCAALRSGSVTAFQFHPEKSGAFGHGLVKQWWEGLP